MDKVLSTYVYVAIYTAKILRYKTFVNFVFKLKHQFSVKSVLLEGGS